MHHKYFLFDSQTWKHDSTQIFITAIIKSLSKKYFLFCSLSWQCSVVYIIRHKFTANTWVKILVVSWLGLRTFCSLYYQAHQFDDWKHLVGTIGHSNYSRKVKSIFWLISGCYDFGIMVRCMLAYIYTLYITFFIMNFLFS